MRLLLGGLLGAFVAIPSLGLVQRYLGPRGLLVYVAGVLAGSILTAYGLEAGTWRGIDRRRARGLAVVLVLAFVVAFLRVYPQLNAGHSPAWLPSTSSGGGSDRDEALNAGVRAVFDGRYPYHERTYLGNPISPLPGSLLLAAPFVWLGNAAWQNVLWFGAWLWILVRVLGDVRHAVAVALISLAASPVLLQDLLTGGDLAVNSIVVLAAGGIAVTARSTRGLIVAGAAAGVALATRVPFILLLPLLVGFVARQWPPRSAWRYSAMLAAAAAVLTLPFYLYDPAAFAPLATQNKFRLLAVAVPYIDVLLPVVCGALGAVALAAVRRASAPWWLVAAGLVLMAPPLMYVAVSLALGSGSVAAAGYALPALMVGVPGVWMLLIGAPDLK